VYICTRITKVVIIKFIENIEIDSVKLCLHNLELSKTILSTIPFRIQVVKII
jgi:hypothetical protein